MESDIDGISDAGVGRRAAQRVADGDHGAASRLLTALAERQRRTLFPSHPSLGRTLGDLALIAYAQGQGRAARDLAESAIDILRRSLGPRSPAMARRMSEFADAAENAGETAYAEELRKRAAQIGTLPATNASTPLDADALHGFGNNLATRGEFEEAECHLREAIRIQRTSPASRQDLAAALSDLGEVLRRTGRFEEAEPVEAEAYAIVQDDNVSDAIRAKVLSNYGLLQTKRSDFLRARQLYHEAIDLFRAASPCSHDLGIAIFNLGALYEDMADATTAERFYVEAADLLERSVGVDHISFSLVANNLGNLYRVTGRMAAAENLLRRAVEVRRHHLDDRHPWLAASLVNLGIALTALGRLGDAVEALTEAIAILQARKQPGIDLPYAYQALAVVRLLERDWTSAETLLDKAIRLDEAALGRDKPVLAQMLSNLAFARAARGEPAEALALMERVADIEDAMLLRAASVLSDHQRLGLMAQLSSHLHQVLAIVRTFSADSPPAIQSAFRHVLTRKAISADVAAAQRDAILAGGDAETRTQMQRLSELTSEIGALATQGSGLVDSQLHRLVDLQRESEDIAARLASSLPELGLRRRLMSAALRDLAVALPHEAMLIELVRSESISFQSLHWSGATYCAFVLIAGDPGELHLVELGATGRIDELVAKMRAAIVASGRSLFGGLRRPTFGQIGRDLAGILIDPLRPSLASTRRIFICPDGALNMLPFELLPFDDKRLVLDCFEVSYVASGRDLLRFGQQRPAPGPPVVIADPNFDLAQPGRAAEADPEAPCFNRLPGTRQEGLRVAALLGVSPWLGNDAVERRLKRVISPRILHIATHGFFRAKGPDETADIDRSAGLTGLAQQLTATTILDNPLLRSGLALAGANCRRRGAVPPEEAEDGFLTAFDVTGMNLTGTRLVVLSACVTGLGDIHPSEGTMGLRRSFTIAGAEALLVSLWSVPDRATRTLMLNFYGALGRGMAPGAALRCAQAKMRRWHRNPYFWGAFVYYGDGCHLLALAEAP